MNDPIITPELVALAGINIPDEQIEAFLDYTNEQLEERIGSAVVELLDDNQLQTLLQLQESASEETIHEWIRENVREFDQVVQDEISILLADIADDKDVINAAS
jgi:(p)ppGpp synthase/HD superfamily hydrolase